MANQFDAASSPTTEPLQIVVGDFIQWRRTDLSEDYPNDAYTATYVARITAAGSSEITIVGSAYGSDYLFNAASSVTAGFTAGFYHWQLEIAQIGGSENRVVVDRGTFTAIVDLDVNGTDPRTHAEVMIDKIESIIEGKADSDVSSYSVAGRSLTKMSFDELISARDTYKRELVVQLQKERASRGKDTGATIKVRFDAWA
jgi:hypothetical protein